MNMKMKESLMHTSIASRCVASTVIATTVLVVGCGGGGSSSTSQVQKPLTLVAESSGPATQTDSVVLTTLSDEFAKQTGGKVKIQVHYNFELQLPPAQMTSLVAKRSLDIGEQVDAFVGGQGGEFPEVGLVGIPGAVPNDLAARKKVSAALAPEYTTFLASKWNQVYLYACQADPRSLISTRPLNSLADLNSLKVRAGGGAELSITQSLGGIPVSGITGGGTYTALQSGAINAAWFPTSAIPTSKLYEVAKNLLHVNVGGAYTIYTINKDAYNELTADNQKKLLSLSKDAGQQCFDKFWDGGLTAVATLKANGVKVTEPSASDTARINALSAPLVDNWASQNGAEGQKLLGILKQTLNK